MKNDLGNLKEYLKNGENTATNSKKKHELEDKIEEIEESIANATAKKHAEVIMEHFQELTDENEEFSNNKMWSLKKKLCDKNRELPMAMVDSGGNMISGKNSLKLLYKTTYEERLKHKPIEEGWEEIKKLKDELFEERIKISEKNKSEDWKLSKVLKICKKLKSGKARDREDLVYELFKPGFAGEDMFLSLLHMFNNIKREQRIPEFFQDMTITSLYKNKGIKSSFSNQRGIFNVSKVKAVMDKILYDDVYPEIDKHLSNSNIGGRRGRNIRDHLFVIYGVINDVINGDSPAVDIQSIDIHKCFDELWYQETHNDMFDAKVQDDKFSIIAKMDEVAQVVVKTPCGITDEFTLKQIIMQGSVFGPIKSTITIDTLGQDCENYKKGLFKYKNSLFLPPLALIDDCLGFSKCSADSVELNAIINTKITSKKLRLSADKCNHLHISKKPTQCYNNLKAGKMTMKKATECSYLGDILSTTGSLDSTIEQRRQKGIGLCSQIVGIVDGLSLGHFYYKISFMFRECKLLNGILTNAEVWYPISEKQLEILENIDLMFIRKLLNGHSKTAKEAFYLETGLIPIRFVCIKRRIIYLHHVLNRPESEIIRKVYEVQKNIPTKNDWFGVVKQNMEDLKINLSDKEISQMSKQKFKKIVNSAVEKAAIDHLNKIARSHSKSENLIKTSLKREEYFEDKRFTKSETELLFAFRTRTVRGIKSNFPSQYGRILTCELCQIAVCCQEHLLSCVILKDHINIPNDVNYTDLFGNTDKQLKLIRILRMLLRKREILLCS